MSNGGKYEKDHSRNIFFRQTNTLKHLLYVWSVFTHVPRIYANNWSKSKRLHKKSQFNSRKIGWNTFMAAVLFFWNFNMAAVKSCQNALYNGYHPHILCIYTSFIIFFCIPFRSVRFSGNGARSYVIPRQDLELIFRRTVCLDLLAIGISPCNVQSGPLIYTLSSVAYGMKQYRAVT